MDILKEKECVISDQSIEESLKDDEPYFTKEEYEEYRKEFKQNKQPT